MKPEVALLPSRILRLFLLFLPFHLSRDEPYRGIDRLHFLKNLFAQFKAQHRIHLQKGQFRDVGFGFLLLLRCFGRSPVGLFVVCHAAIILAWKIRHRRQILPEAATFRATRKRTRQRRGSVKATAFAELAFPAAMQLVAAVRAVESNPSLLRASARTKVVPPRFPREPVAVADLVVQAIACPLEPVPPTCRRLKDNRTVPADDKVLVKDIG